MKNNESYIFNRLKTNAIESLLMAKPKLQRKELSVAECKVFFVEPLRNACGMSLQTGDIKQTGDSAYYVESTMREFGMLVAYGFFLLRCKKGETKCERKQLE